MRILDIVFRIMVVFEVRVGVVIIVIFLLFRFWLVLVFLCYGFVIYS